MGYASDFLKWNRYKNYTRLLESGDKKEYKSITVCFDGVQDIRDLANQVEHLVEQGWEWEGFDSDYPTSEICLSRKILLPEEEIRVMRKWLEENPDAKYPPGHKKEGD